MVVGQKFAKVRKKRMREFMKNREPLALDWSVFMVFNPEFTIRVGKNTPIAANVVAHLFATYAKNT
jgi:hypothetical protein